MPTYRSNYEIGLNLGSMVNIETVVTNPPFQDSYVTARLAIDQADSLVSEHGWGETSWKWGFITLDDRNALKVYCPNKSTELYVRVRGSSGAFVYCKAVMVWPTTEEPPVVSRVLDFGVNFRIIENYGASSQ